MAVEAGAPPPQAQRVPMDQRDRLVGHERVAEEHPQQGPVRQRRRREVQARVEEQRRRPGLIDLMRRRDGSSRTRTVYPPRISMKGET